MQQNEKEEDKDWVEYKVQVQRKQILKRPEVYFTLTFNFSSASLLHLVVTLTSVMHMFNAHSVLLQLTNFHL